jgi:hypothetical protein
VSMHKNFARKNLADFVTFNNGTIYCVIETLLVLHQFAYCILYGTVLANVMFGAFLYYPYIAKRWNIFLFQVIT